KLIALQVYPWPLARLQGLLDLWRSPVHQSLAFGGLDDHQMPGIIGPGHLPRSAIDPRAILTGVHFSGLKAVEALMLVIVKHGQQANALVVEGTGYGYRIDGAVDDKECSPCGQGNLVAIGDNDLRHMYVGWIIRDKEGMARCVMGHDGVRA